ncbi:MAG TPA: rhodanese-like domain-containing protein [Desulfosporosinus sp.]|nr:rhodanese-like domain-containing protein [Desulfosporosinus sp.]
MAKSISPVELKNLLESDELFALIDVREGCEYERGHIFGAAIISRRSLERKILKSVPNKDIKTVIYSGQGNRALCAANTLEKGGYTNVYILAGGLDGWKSAGFPEVKGLHVPSKAFGEIVGEIWEDVMPISPEELHAHLSKYTVIEVRPAEEVNQTGSIPGAVNIPGVELFAAISDYIERGKKVVLTCAGRTRGFIASATVKKLGLGEVRDLTNGTLGWILAGYELQKEMPAASVPSSRSRNKARLAAQKLAHDNHIPFISPEGLKFRQENLDKNPLYIIDTRTKHEYEAGHIADSLSYPGGQAIQNAEDAVPVRGADIVLVSDGETRSSITAYWYIKMGFPHVFVLKDGLNGWKERGYVLERGSPPRLYLDYERCRSSVELLGVEAARESLSGKNPPILIDVSYGRDFAGGHIQESRWIPRGRLEERISTAVPEKSTYILLTAADSVEAVFAAVALSELGYRNVKVIEGGCVAWAAKGYPLDEGSAGFDLNDWHISLSEYGKKEAKEYFAWEESLVHDNKYMAHFQRLTII